MGQRHKPSLQGVRCPDERDGFRWGDAHDMDHPFGPSQPGQRCREIWISHAYKAKAKHPIPVRRYRSGGWECGPHPGENIEPHRKTWPRHTCHQWGLKTTGFGREIVALPDKNPLFFSYVIISGRRNMRLKPGGLNFSPAERMSWPGLHRPRVDV